jgi:hypothetical protein
MRMGGGETMKEIILPNGTKLAPIPSLPENDYMAGNDGRIYSRKYKGKMSIGSSWYPLIGYKDKGNYYCVDIYIGKRLHKKVHRLICEAFHGSTPEGKNIIRHLDGNPQNNKPENLAWGTNKENWADQKRHGRGYEGEKHPRSKLTNFERNAIRWIIKKNIASISQIAKALNMTYRAISYVHKPKN